MRGYGWLLVFSLGLAGCQASQAGSSGDPAHWFQCRQPADCVLLSGSSCTPPVALHKDFVSAYNQAHEDDPVCGPGGYDPERGVAHAECRQSRCTVIYRKSMP